MWEFIDSIIATVNLMVWGSLVLILIGAARNQKRPDYDRHRDTDSYRNPYRNL